MALPTLLPFFILICISETSSQDSSYIDVNCKSENHGLYQQHSILDCVVQLTEEAKDATIVTVIWRKEGDDAPRLKYSGDINSQQGFGFAVRDWNKKNMNVSLLVKNTDVADAGTYNCMVVTDKGRNTEKTKLIVTATYNAPTISLIPQDNRANPNLSLFCNTSGGYPEGQIHWFGKDGSDIESNLTHRSVLVAKIANNGLFNLSSKLTLLSKSAFSKYRCLVNNAAGAMDGQSESEGQEGPSTHDSHSGSKNTSTIVAPVVVIGSLIVGLLCALLFFRRRSNQARRPSTAPLMSHHSIPNNDPDVNGAEAETL